MPRAVLTVYSDTPQRVGVRFPYDPEVNERLKDHGGLWDPDVRTWHVPGRSLKAVAAILAAEFDMEVVDDTGLAAVNGQRPVVVDRIAFYEAMLRRLPEAERLAKYRDLMRVFHPDAQGDPEEAKAVNAAWDRINGRNRRGA